MSYTKTEIIQYQLQRARNTLAAAHILAAESYWNDVANRLYYTSFYAISAYLKYLDIEPSTHKGLRIMFHKHVIKKRLMDVEWGEFFDELWDKRQEGDYETMILFDGTNILPLLNKGEAFVENISRLITDQ